MRTLLVPLLMGLALLSGCVGDDALATEEAEPAFEGAQFEGSPDVGTPAGTASGHGEPKREESAVTTGTDPLQLFSAWASRTVTITNDFGGASLGVVSVAVSAGSVKVQPGSGPGYEVVAVLEAHAATEQEARDALDRITLSHDDALQADGLHLTTGARYEPPATPIVPMFTLGNGVWTTVDLTYTVPAGPAYDLWATASSGDVSVADLRGPRFRLDASSGDLAAEGLNAGLLALDVSSGEASLTTIQAQALTADLSSGNLHGDDLAIESVKVDSSSGGVELAGRFDSLSVSSSSGDVQVVAQPTRSGGYSIEASSGNVELILVTGSGQGYDVLGEASSGQVSIELPDVEVVDESADGDAKHVVSLAFDDAEVQTGVKVTTSSGDITISGADALTGLLPSTEVDGEDEHNHGGGTGSA